MMKMAQLYYQGHGSYRIATNQGTIIYIDPFAGTGYDLPADLVLITHEHHDHNNISLVTQKPDCLVIRESDALKNGEYASFTVKDVKIETAEAYNDHHKKEESVGYLLTLDHITVYAAGDTSETQQMKSMKNRSFDWALLPIDGIYNMDPEGASKCAALIGAKHTIPIHMKPGQLFDRTCAEAFHVPGRVIVEPGETIEL
jgi:L-ascorbate metabolism protein UlaG (beta-lactamase superfamily)